MSFHSSPLIQALDECGYDRNNFVHFVGVNGRSGCGDDNDIIDVNCFDVKQHIKVSVWSRNALTIECKNIDR